jgi:hypothetical protein
LACRESYPIASGIAMRARMIIVLALQRALLLAAQTKLIGRGRGATLGFRR